MSRTKVWAYCCCLLLIEKRPIFIQSAVDFDIHYLLGLQWVSAIYNFTWNKFGIKWTDFTHTLKMITEVSVPVRA